MEPIKAWRFTDEEAVAQHLENCPFNVRQPLKAMPKNGQWDKVLASFKSAMKLRALQNS